MSTEMRADDLRKLTKDIVYEYIFLHSNEFDDGVVTSDLSKKLGMQRTNLSTILNQLVREGKLKKEHARPVKYYLSDVDNQEMTPFKYIVGHQTTYKQSINLVKAGLIYPDYGLACLIVGDKGTGKSYFAELMYRFVIEEGLLSKDAQLIKINCVHHVLQSSDSSGTEIEEILKNSRDQFVFIEHINVLDEVARSIILSKIEQQHKNFYLVCTIDSVTDVRLQTFLTSKFAVCIHLPRIDEIALVERFDLIMHFFHNESVRFNRDIDLNGEILRNLLLYPCAENIKQLKKDIRLACATAYLREVEQDKGVVTLYMQDFHSDVHKGFMFYPDKRSEVERIIPANFSYRVTPKGLERERLSTRNESSIYYKIDSQVDFLRTQGVSSSEIQNLVLNRLASLESSAETPQAFDGFHFNRESLVNVVGKELVELVEAFLDLCRDQVDDAFDTHLASIAMYLYLRLTHVIETDEVIQDKNNIEIHHHDLFQAASKFIEKVNGRYFSEFGEQEILHIVSELAKSQEKQESDAAKLQLLVVMHGENTAQSIVNVAKELIFNANVHYYDLQLSKELQVSYDELKRKIIEIDCGKGVFVLYDMGSIKSMIDTISRDTGIYIRSVAIPLTLIVLECVRNLDRDLTLESYQKETQSLVAQSFELSQQVFQQNNLKKLIITLCTAGNGAAFSMKDYIEKHAALTDVEILAMAWDNKISFRRKISELKKQFQIASIVGTVNPKISEINFVSAHQLYGTKTEDLALLLADGSVADTFEMDYSEIYKYLKEQQPSLNISRLKRVLPRCLKKIKKVSKSLSKSQEVGLFIHLACLISYLQQGKQYPDIPNTDKIIISNKTLYYHLKSICLEIEVEFEIEIPDSDYANMIRTIKEI